MELYKAVMLMTIGALLSSAFTASAMDPSLCDALLSSRPLYVQRLVKALDSSPSIPGTPLFSFQLNAHPGESRGGGDVELFFGSERLVFPQPNASQAEIGRLVQISQDLKSLYLHAGSIGVAKGGRLSRDTMPDGQWVVEAMTESQVVSFERLGSRYTFTGTFALGADATVMATVHIPLEASVAIRLKQMYETARSMKHWGDKQEAHDARRAFKTALAEEFLKSCQHTAEKFDRTSALLGQISPSMDAARRDDITQQINAIWPHQ